MFTKAFRVKSNTVIKGSDRYSASLIFKRVKLNKIYLQSESDSALSKSTVKLLCFVHIVISVNCNK